MQKETALRFKCFVLVVMLLAYTACGCQSDTPQNTTTEGFYTELETESVAAVEDEELLQEILEVLLPPKTEHFVTLETLENQAISDVRITISEVDDDSVMNQIAGESKTTLLRIYYGYCIDGVWTDKPSEHYPLKELFSETPHDSFRASFFSHCVRIGPYLLIALNTDSSEKDGSKVFCEPTDSLGSEFVQMFEEYFTPFYRESGTSGYSFFAKEPFQYGASVTSYNFNHFGLYHYLILEWDSIPEDYRLEYTYEQRGEMITKSVTYEQLKALLEGSDSSLSE